MMDTSKEYIEMCEKSEEIQNRRLIDGDYYCITRGNKIITQGIAGVSNAEMDSVDFRFHKSVWLPHQDELQKMSEMQWWEFDKRCADIRRCVMEDPLSDWELKSKEQAGLCVVMERKYNKIWNNDKKEWERNE